MCNSSVLGFCVGGSGKTISYGGTLLLCSTSKLAVCWLAFYYIVNTCRVQLVCSVAALTALQAVYE